VASSYEEAKRTIARGDGIARLSVAQLAALGYGLTRDDDSHGCITGLPEHRDLPTDDHLNAVLKAADQLLDIARNLGIATHKWRTP
jgi:hypothetical protein